MASNLNKLRHARHRRPRRAASVGRATVLCCWMSQWPTGAIRDMPDTSENALLPTCPIESPHRAEVRAARRGGFSGRVSARCNDPRRPRAPHHRGAVGLTEALRNCGDATVRKPDDACIPEAASARAGVPPRSPRTSNSCAGPACSDACCARSNRESSRGHSARSPVVLCEREPRISRGACSRSEAGAQLLGWQAKRGALTAGAIVSV